MIEDHINGLYMIINNHVKMKDYVNKLHIIENINLKDHAKRWYMINISIMIVLLYKKFLSYYELVHQLLQK